MSIICLSIDSDLANVALVDYCVRALCESTPLPAEQVYGVQLAVAEWLNNIIIHGYGKKPGQAIELYLELDACLTISIIDHGKCFSCAHKKRDATRETHSTNDYDNLPEGGWGLYLIEQCMDSLHYSTNEHCNTMKMIKHYAVPA